MKIRLLTPPYRGLVIKQASHVAMRLIAAGKAEAVDGPAVVEIAEAPRLEVETAEAPHAKKPKRKKRGRRKS